MKRRSGGLPLLGPLDAIGYHRGFPSPNRRQRQSGADAVRGWGASAPAGGGRVEKWSRIRGQTDRYPTHQKWQNSMANHLP